MEFRKLVCGVGTNDADYAVSLYEKVGSKYRKVWICPFYKVWKGMLCRCYHALSLSRNPTYLDCSVVPEWHRFSAFKAWMETQDWGDKELDKDLLVPGNKVYGPDTCVFVSSAVNKFMLDSAGSRGKYPVGACFHKASGKFQAVCNNPFVTMPSGRNRLEYLGLYETPEKAHAAWSLKKWEFALKLASIQDDDRIASALKNRFTMEVI